MKWTECRVWRARLGRFTCEIEQSALEGFKYHIAVDCEDGSHPFTYGREKTLAQAQEAFRIQIQTTTGALSPQQPVGDET